MHQSQRIAGQYAAATCIDSKSVLQTNGQRDGQGFPTGIKYREIISLLETYPADAVIIISAGVKVRAGIIVPSSQDRDRQFVGMSATRAEAGRGNFPRHRHSCAYVSLVMDGGYCERGSMGRWSIEPGQLVAHASFESHDNLVARSGAWVLNIPVLPCAILPPVFTVEDPDAIVAAVRSGLPVASILQPVRAMPARHDDWADMLAAELRREPVSITEWAGEAGFDAATVSRGFYAAFGVTPARYRLENQTLRAMGLIASTAEPLAGCCQSNANSSPLDAVRSLRLAG